MNYMEIKPVDIANGLGVRVSLFVSGCPLRCKGCHNPEAWDFDAGKPFTRFAVEELFKALGKPYAAGLSILGGEPLAPQNVDAVDALLTVFRQKFGETRDVWLYTGYTLEELLDRPDAPKLGSILGNVDVLVDGRFEQDKADAGLAFKGSTNQRILDVAETFEQIEKEMYYAENQD